MLECGIPSWLPLITISLDIKAHKKKSGQFHGEEGQHSCQEASRFNTAKLLEEHLSFTFSLPRMHPLLAWRLLLRRGSQQQNLRPRPAAPSVARRCHLQRCAWKSFHRAYVKPRNFLC